MQHPERSPKSSNLVSPRNNFCLVVSKQHGWRSNACCSSSFTHRKTLVEYSKVLLSCGMVVTQCLFQLHYQVTSFIQYCYCYCTVPSAICCVYVESYHKFTIVIHFPTTQAQIVLRGNFGRQQLSPVALCYCSHRKMKILIQFPSPYHTMGLIVYNAMLKLKIIS